MRDNFRPNVRLTTNILLVIGTFLIAFKIGSLNKYTKHYQQRKADCAGTTAVDLPEVRKDFLKKYNLESFNTNTRNLKDVIRSFCSFYLK